MPCAGSAKPANGQRDKCSCKTMNIPYSDRAMNMMAVGFPVVDLNRLNRSRACAMTMSLGGGVEWRDSGLVILAQRCFKRRACVSRQSCGVVNWELRRRLCG